MHISSSQKHELQATLVERIEVTVERLDRIANLMATVYEAIDCLAVPPLALRVAL